MGESCPCQASLIRFKFVLIGPCFFLFFLFFLSIILKVENVSLQSGQISIPTACGVACGCISEEEATYLRPGEGAN